MPDTSVAAVRSAAEVVRGEVIAVLEPGGRAAANWLGSTVPFLARTELMAVVSPKLAPLHGPVLERAAAAIDESRIGVGFGYFRFPPGNVRFVTDYPAASFVIRRGARCRTASRSRSLCPPWPKRPARSSIRPNQ